MTKSKLMEILQREQDGIKERITENYNQFMQDIARVETPEAAAHIADIFIREHTDLVNREMENRKVMHTINALDY